MCINTTAKQRRLSVDGTFAKHRHGDHLSHVVHAQKCICHNYADEKRKKERLEKEKRGGGEGGGGGVAGMKEKELR